MKLQIPIVSCLLASLGDALETRPKACGHFPTSIQEFTSGFQQPKPPMVKTEFQTSFIQHKWYFEYQQSQRQKCPVTDAAYHVRNANLSHVSSGYLYFSPSQKMVRADEAYEGALATSIFDYGNTTQQGLVMNTVTSYSVGSPKPSVWSGYVLSNYPLFAEDFLIKGDAVFGGLVTRNLLQGHVASWNIMFMGSIPVTAFVDACGVLVGYDYFSPGLRTRVTTDFFNTAVGPVKI
ncbi:hypothetical protein N7539_002282 [Penicillium diatomitis]|uniref:Uncharacterized protein n=1 Tax=Penicillium diatomitis TaxID=2819901 RepID=A0A9W9XEE6_9EURO|nr:uncharacterized protein N7539_002282 [Penicillium diatomitis]KAJ5490715.1 hypothetical protein N7539_002282 [Penicillium diatomitis]